MKLRQVIGFLSLIATLYIFWQIRQILLLAFTAVVLATALNQIVKKIQSFFHLKRFLAVLLTLVVFLAIFITFFGLILPPFVEQFQELIKIFPRLVSILARWANWLEENFPRRLYPNLPNFSTSIQQTEPHLIRFFTRSFSLFSASINAVLEFLFVWVLTLMFLADPQPYRRALIRLFPAFYRHRVDQILCRCEESLSHWVVGALIEMVFIGSLSAIGLWILQVQLALAHGFLAGLLNFIPNIGPTLSVFFPMAIALLDEPWKVGAVLILYIVIQQIESYWLTPLVMAKQVSLFPAITLLSQIFFAAIFGPLGLLMSLPLTVVAKTWIEELLFHDLLDKWKRQSNLQLENNSALEPAAMEADSSP